NPYMAGPRPFMPTNQWATAKPGVPPGFFFPWGNTRDSSLDSRYWGFVPRANIIGKPIIIYWSYEASTDALSQPVISVNHLLDLVQHFPSKTRWRRTLRPVRGYPLN